ncbi:hypothetical protein O9929_17625 [Vibrio lentus]|nr:hypothetical protein [Vibrio lentus]
MAAAEDKRLLYMDLQQGQQLTVVTIAAQATRSVSTFWRQTNAQYLGLSTLLCSGNSETSCTVNVTQRQIS